MGLLPRLCTDAAHINNFHAKVIKVRPDLTLVSDAALCSREQGDCSPPSSTHAICGCLLGYW